MLNDKHVYYYLYLIEDLLIIPKILILLNHYFYTLSILRYLVLEQLDILVLLLAELILSILLTCS